jgi:hypothetical protein
LVRHHIAGNACGVERPGIGTNACAALAAPQPPPRGAPPSSNRRSIAVGIAPNACVVGSATAPSADAWER